MMKYLLEPLNPTTRDSREKLPISLFVITKNEVDRVGRVIESCLHLVDEIIVVDSGSTDGTKELVVSMGAKLYLRDWTGYLDQKIYGESLCTNEWILNLDADEALSREAEEEIRAIFHVNQDKVAYRLPITIVHRLDFVLRRFAPTNNPIRLYNKEYCGYRLQEQSLVHDSVIVSSDRAKDVGEIRSRVYHQCSRSIFHMIEKGNSNTSLQAIDMWNKGKRISRVKLLLEFPVSFFKIFFLRRYFIYGINGFVDSMIYAFIRFLRVAKYDERHKEIEYKKHI